MRERQGKLSWLEGKAIKEPAGPVKTYKLTDEELHEVWRKYGPPKKSRKTHSLTKELLMKRLYLQKRTVGQIAFEFKVSPYLVKKLIEQWGLKEKEEGQCMSG